MDLEEYRAKILRLAGVGSEGVSRSELSANDVVARLGYAAAAIFLQKACVVLGISSVSVWSLGSVLAGWQLYASSALVIGLLCTVARALPYWMPEQELREGLIGLSQLPIRNPKKFLEGQTTDLSRVTTKMLNQQAMGITRDQQAQH